jgi:hypothetical protein
MRQALPGGCGNNIAHLPLIACPSCLPASAAPSVSRHFLMQQKHPSMHFTCHAPAYPCRCLACYDLSVYNLLRQMQIERHLFPAIFFLQ